MSQKEKAKSKEKVEVLDLRRKRVKPPKLRLWALLGLILLVSGSAIGMLKTNHAIPSVDNPNDKSGPSKITVSTNATNPGGTGTGTPPPPTQTVTFVHGHAHSTTFTAETVEFEGLATLYVAINTDSNSINYTEYSTYLPTGSYGVQMWQNGGDTRPECTVRNGILNPFVVNGQADQVQDFACMS